MKKRFGDFLNVLENTAADETYGKRAFSNYSGIHPDESIFWNVEGTDNAGFIIPIERYNDIGELYLRSKKLIDGQREFLYKITRCEKSDNGSEGKFYPVNKDNFFGCGSMKELYRHYLTIFEGEMGFNGFCEMFSGYLEDKNGVLCVRHSGSGSQPCVFDEEWENRFVLIYDVTDSTASMAVALPIAGSNPKRDGSDVSYRFEAMEMRKGERGWRLTDLSLFVN